LSAQRLRRMDTRWGEASRTGQAIPDNLVMAHNDNNYHKVTMDTVRADTSRNNNIDTWGKKVLVRYEKENRSVTYNSIVEAAEAHGIAPSTLRNALRKYSFYCFNDVRFLYFVDIKPKSI